MKKVVLLGLALLMAATVAAPASAAPRKPAIGASADRVVALQRTDAGWAGTWYWYVGSSYNATNLTGVTALGLLEAYRDSKDAAYLETAKAAAAFSMAHLGAGATGTRYHARMTAPDVTLLHRLTQVTGDAQYAVRATAEWNNIKGFWPTAGALDSVFRSTNRRLGAWDLAAFMEAAKLSGDEGWATAAAAILANAGDSFYYGSGNPYLALNVAGALRALVGSGHASNYPSEAATLLGMLVGTTSEDGIGGCIQDTAYGAMALKAVGGPATPYANTLAKWLASKQEAGGGWVEGDGLEYPEVVGEAVQGLASTIGANVTLNGFKPGPEFKARWRADASRGIARPFDTP
ncbi:MAG: hypothetical protein ACYC3V_20785 [Chloroflexota bacterium]